MNGIVSLRGKKILITSFSYAHFGGAELNAVELADQLVEFGMKPTFFSYDTNGPLKAHIEERFTTKILSDQINKLSETEDENELGMTKLNIEDYDYIWVGGNTVPVSIIRQVNTAKKLPKFIFIHMSQLVAFPLDAPLMPEFEKKIASKILSISEKTTTDNIQRILGKDVVVDEWSNPVPKDFSALKKRSGNLKKIAIISSSHPGDEIIEIKQLIEQAGVAIDYIGKFNNNIKVVDAKFYDEYDLIIGIGKNARYSMVSGVPIYIYGRFGGGGYITEDNLAKNETHNFSGRGFGKKDTATIAQEILSGYKGALKFHETHRKEFIEKLSIDNAALRLFTELEKQKAIKVRFDEQYINWLISMQINLMQRHQRTAWLYTAETRVQDLEVIVRQLKEKNALLSADVIAFKMKARQLRDELRGIYASKSWTLTKPVRAANSVVKKLKKKLQGS